MRQTRRQKRRENPILPALGGFLTLILGFAGMHLNPVELLASSGGATAPVSVIGKTVSTVSKVASAAAPVAAAAGGLPPVIDKSTQAEPESNYSGSYANIDCQAGCKVEVEFETEQPKESVLGVLKGVLPIFAIGFM